MATSRKSTTKASPRKSTPAGRAGKTSPTRKSTRAAGSDKPDTAPPPAAAAAEKRAQLRAVESAPAVAPAEPVAASDDTRFKRPDLIEAVAEKTALKRGDAKIVLELVLQELGRALDENEELVLPPLGKLMVKKRKPDADGPDVLTLKLRRPGPATAKGGESPLADPDEDG